MCKQEDPSSEIQHPTQKLSVAVQVCNSCTGGQETERSLKLADQPLKLEQSVLVPVSEPASKIMVATNEQGT